MRFVFSPPAEEYTGLLSLPWAEPLESWKDERLVEIRQRGLSRHVVRFVSDDGVLYALKSISERLARREYQLLRYLAELSVPAVEVVGVAVDLGPDADAILVTKFLPFATTYRAVFSSPRGGGLPTDKLLDALVELLVRLHLSGFFWGDCSLSNTLFRRDAGALAAYLVDAETGEMHPQLSRGQRLHDLSIATENIAGELMDLQAGGYLSEDADPVEMAQGLQPRYDQLWAELTDDQVYPAGESYRIEERVRRLNSLGFDVSEIGIRTEDAGRKLRFETHVVEPGHHQRRVYALTGLRVQENQARLILSDLARFRAKWIEGVGHDIPEDLAARRWLDEKFYGVLSMVPPELRRKLPDAELFHEIAEHRWLMSERSGQDVGRQAAVQDYVQSVLASLPDASVRVLTDPITEEFPVIRE
ncbi:MAG: DUF4032 domain-containing protein [Actinobacteria bacterium]|nr:DUF4032 domain-containing protein [Actinomycetota bacterium]